MTAPPAISEAGLLYWQDAVYLCGGKTTSASKDCYKSEAKDRVYGTTWTLQDDHALPTARFGSSSFAATAEAMYVLGGCASDNTAVASNLFMHNKGEGWEQVVTKEKTIEMNLLNGALQVGESFPPKTDALCGSTLLVVDGWQLMLLGGGLGKVYVSMNAEHTMWAVASSAPGFDSAEKPRKNALAGQTSDGMIFVMGGHWAQGSTWGTDVFSDVWCSSNGGKTWEIATANFARTMSFTPEGGVASYGQGYKFAGVKTIDDTFILTGGGQVGGTQPQDWTWASQPGDLDLKRPTMQHVCPALLTEPFVLIFDEHVARDHNMWHVKHVADDGKESDVKHTVDQQGEGTVYEVIPAAALTQAAKYKITLKQGAFSDHSGNTNDEVSFECTAPTDIVAPLSDVKQEKLVVAGMVEKTENDVTSWVAFTPDQPDCGTGCRSEEHTSELQSP